MKHEFAKKLTPYAKTVRDTALLVGVGIGISALSHAVGLPIGNAAESQAAIQSWMQNPVQGLLQASVVGPLIEESEFRLVPSLLINSFDPEKKGKPVWAIGIPVAITFALLHNFVSTKSGLGVSFQTDMLPIQQFLAGLVFWNAARKRGIQHSYISHSLNNALAFGLLELGLKI